MNSQFIPGPPVLNNNPPPTSMPYNPNNSYPQMNQQPFSNGSNHNQYAPQQMPPQNNLAQKMQDLNLGSQAPPSQYPPQQRPPQMMQNGPGNPQAPQRQPQMPPQNNQLWAPNDGPAMPPSNMNIPSSTPQMPPLSGAPSMIPGQQNRRMPPTSQMGGSGPQMPPMGSQMMPPVGSQMPPMSTGSQMPSMGSQMGSQMPPISSGSQMPPMSTGPQMPPMSTGPQMSSMGPQMPPMGSQMPPMSMGSQIPPTSMGPSMPPNSQMRPPMPQYPGMPQSAPMNKPNLPPTPGSFPKPGMPPMGSMPQPGMPPMPSNQMNSMQQPGKPGYPPMPGQQQQPGFQKQGYQNNYPNQHQQFPNQQQGYGGYEQKPQQRLNPDHMPSPINVVQDDQNNNGGLFVTNQKGLVPPLVTTNFTVDDKGNASPRYVRSSMYSVPATADILKQVAIPFCLVVSPLAETVGAEKPPPLLNFAQLTGNPEAVPVRCCRCKAYMCPAMKFVDAGRHFQCAFCKATTEVPMEYTQYLNNTQAYGQCIPEMSLGCYEIAATKEYCRNNTLPNPPALIFVVDVSYNSVRSGLVRLVVSHLKELVLKMETPMRIGLITYSSTIHFYNINENLAQPQMMVVGDVQDVFVPLARGLLVEPEKAEHLLDALTEQIPNMFQENKETETILLPAVQAGLEALKAAECAGKLLIFHSSLPTGNAPGKLLNRDDRKLLGTDKEKNILNPQTKAYNEVAQECVGSGCGIELFLFNSSYIDAATLGQLPRLTGGTLHKYTYFQADVDGERLLADLSRVITRPTAFDAVMRVRTSTGIRATDFYGNFFMSNTTDVDLACLDSDKAIGVEIKHDDKLTGEDGVYIQVALLYTHMTGQRRLRICNLSLDIASQMADFYRCCDLDTTMNFLSKQAVWRLSEHPPKSVKEGIIARCVQSLVCYRKHCASPTSVGQLVLPETMKLLPLYSNCLIRSDALSGGSDMSCDDRSWAMQNVLSATVAASVVYLYPRLLDLSPLLVGSTPAQIRCSAEKLRSDTLYLLENGVHMMLWIGLQTPSDITQGVFGVNSVAEVNTETQHLPTLNTQLSETLRSYVNQVREKRKRHMRLTMVRQHDKLEAVFRHFLVEDQSHSGAASYVDFLCHVHKEIRDLL